jgi:hypothetical protein
MDAGRISLMIGVLALLLAVPLAVIANLLTPKVQRWYATTSRAAMRARIAEIDEKLKQLEGEWKFTKSEWATYQTVNELLTWFLMLAMLFFSFALFLVPEKWDLILHLAQPPLSWVVAVTVAVIALVGYVVSSISLKAHLKDSNEILDWHHPNLADKLAGERAFLEQQLHKED